MNIAKLAGFVCGFLVSIVLVFLLLKWIRKDRGGKCKYDERQEIVRGRGFKYGFFAMAISNVVYGVIDMSVEKKFIDTFAALFICIAVGILVYVGYCIWNEGYFALNENPKKVCILFITIALLNLLPFGVRVAQGKFVENGVIGFSIVNLICGLMFLAIFVIMFLKWNYDKREAE